MIPKLPAHAAYLLDLDGTLLDIASTPDAVIVAPNLVDNLCALRIRCGGALAIVTGRTLREVDALIGDAPTAVAAEHGTALRHAPDAPVVTTPIESPSPSWLGRATQLVATHPGTTLEHKRHGFVVHYRGAPDAGAAIESSLRTLLAEDPQKFALLAAKMAWEIRPAGVDKGFAVRAIMAKPPFAGRTPIFVGDDVTDEDGIAAAQALGGLGLRVAEAFGEPADVRAWIAQLAASTDGA